MPPFDDPSYDVFEMRSQENDLEAESREQNAKSRDASRNAARYGGLGVMFAAVLAAVGSPVSSTENNRAEFCPHSPADCS